MRYTGAWPNPGEEERKLLLNHRVHPRGLVVEALTGRILSNTKAAVVTLRTAPHEPRCFALRGQGTSAAARSDLTDSSDSSTTLDDSAALASAEPIRPSAQTACADPWLRIRKRGIGIIGAARP